MDALFVVKQAQLPLKLESARNLGVERSSLCKDRYEESMKRERQMRQKGIWIAGISEGLYWMSRDS